LSDLDDAPYRVREFQPPPQQGDGAAKPPLFPQFVWDGDREPAPPDELIEDTIGERAVVFIGGQSGAGKSFLLMEMARCLMIGTAFFGRHVTRKVGVAVLAPEGDETLTGRLAALKKAHDIQGNLPFTYLGPVPNLMDPAERKRVVEALKNIDARMREKFSIPLGVLFMDTLAATFDMEDENDNSEASRVIRFTKEMRDELGITIVLVHHYGKTAETGLRGASAWRGGIDQLLSVLADRNEVTGDVTIRELAVAKNRGGPEGPIGPFELEFVQLGLRENLKPWGSLVVVPRLDLPPTMQTARKKPAGTKPQRTFDDAFAEAIIAGETYKTFNGTGPTVRAVRIVPTLKDIFFAKYQTGEDDPKKTDAQNEATRVDAKRKAFQRAMRNLPAKYATDEHNGVEWIWLVTTNDA